MHCGRSFLRINPIARPETQLIDYCFNLCNYIWLHCLGTDLGFYSDNVDRRIVGFKLSVKLLKDFQILHS